MRDLLMSIESVSCQGLEEAIRDVVGALHLWDLGNHFDILLMRQIVVRFVGEFLLSL